MSSICKNGKETIRSRLAALMAQQYSAMTLQSTAGCLDSHFS